MLEPHLSQYWLNAKPEKPEEFKQEVNQVCNLYVQAPELYLQGVHVISTDEMTGIQALERAYPTDEMKPGKIERQEFEYIRHGTLSLIASWDVQRGLVAQASLGETRERCMIL